MQTLFDFCVELLYKLAALTGTTYVNINIYLFVLLHPLLTLSLCIICLRQRRLLKLARCRKG